MKTYLGLIVASLFVMPIIAQQADQPINFSADNMVIDEKSRTTELNGHATLKRGALDMKANVIMIYSKAVGDEEVFDRMEGTGSVVAKSGDQTITADFMTYTASTETAVFTGGVVVKKGKSVANANKAVLDVGSGIYTLSGPVKGVISGTLP